MDRQELLSRVAEGRHRLEVDEALRLFEEAGLDELGAAAHRMRVRLNGDQDVTYLVDRNVNYTNVCITDCKFCEFYRPPGHGEAYVLSRAELFQKIRETIAVGGTRILLQGGHHPELDLAWYVGTLRAIKAEFPGIELNAF